jgi:hypothetical protein
LDPTLAGITKKGTSPITNIAPRLLCKDCNSNRLSPNMQESLPWLIALSAGDLMDIPPHATACLRRYLERIAVIVDVCTSSEQVSASRARKLEHKLSELHRQAPALLTPADRASWLDGARLDRLRMALGRHKGLLGVNPDVTVVHGYADSGVTSWKRMTFVVGHLAVCLDIEAKGFSIPVHFGPPGTFHLLESIQSWPTEPEASYDDYFSLRHQDAHTQNLRRTLQLPFGLAALEATLAGGAD